TGEDADGWAGGKNSSLNALRYIGVKTFYKSRGVWRESSFDPTKNKDVKTVKVGSDEFFNLLAADTRLAQYLALGDVVLKVKGEWLRFESVKK
ncbi:MAG: hypothetical protein N2C14_04605, partial [Planctomycetales bacterium]